MGDNKQYIVLTVWQKAVNLLSILVLLVLSMLIVWFFLNLAAGNVRFDHDNSNVTSQQFLQK